MRRTKVVFLGALLFFLSSSTQVLALDLYGFASYWDKKDADGTLGMGIGLSLPFFTDFLRLDGRAHYFEETGAGPGNDDVKMNPFDLGLQVHFMPSNPVDFYILGGVSYVYVDAPDWTNLDSELGAYIGAGLDIELGTSFFKLFTEALYRYAELDGILEDKTDISGFTVNAGVKFHF